MRHQRGEMGTRERNGTGSTLPSRTAIQRNRKRKRNKDTPNVIAHSRRAATGGGVALSRTLFLHVVRGWRGAPQPVSRLPQRSDR